ncbi:GNAT family N-acetyltransferase [Pseudoneobacillus sp. C159]
MIQSDELLIRYMTSYDYNVMVTWLNNQKLLEFYEEPPSNLDMVKQKYGPRVEGRDYVKSCIVEYQNQPIGYIQYYEIQDEDLHTYGFAKNQNIFGIDQFIGETELWGKGIGTKMIKLMLNHLTNIGASKVVLEVKKNNTRAISSYIKCGFRQSKELNHNLILMVWSEEN